jgi:hypothetical protein
MGGQRRSRGARQLDLAGSSSCVREGVPVPTRLPWAVASPLNEECEPAVRVDLPCPGARRPPPLWRPHSMRQW